jgi:hypothetical protein
MGQENPYDAEMYQANAAPTNSRLNGTIKSGFQTPKTLHGSVELIIPMLFWFKDIQIAIPSVAIPSGNRFIQVTLAQQNFLVGQEIRGDAVAGTIGVASVNTCELYVNNIFVNPEIHDIYIKRIGFNLIRIHKRQYAVQNQSANEILLSNFKFPIESICLAFQNTANVLNTNVDYGGASTGINHLDHWHYMSRVSRVDVTGNPITTYVDSQDYSVNNLTITSHGVVLYDNFPSLFYSSYIPFIKKSVTTPFDIGVHLVTFNVNTYEFQPSGHINLSRGREFYVSYNSTLVNTPISPTNPVYFIACAKAINFLLVSDGSCVLRYST